MAIWITVIAVACIPIICLIRGMESLRLGYVEADSSEFLKTEEGNALFNVTLIIFNFIQTERRPKRAIWKWEFIFLFPHRFSERCLLLQKYE
jgi:hypothetical protein